MERSSCFSVQISRWQLIVWTVPWSQACSGASMFHLDDYNEPYTTVIVKNSSQVWNSIPGFVTGMKCFMAPMLVAPTLSDETMPKILWIPLKQLQAILRTPYTI